MPYITQLPADSACAGEKVPVEVDRHTLEKRRWRTVAADKTDLAVDLPAPCRDGDVLHVENGYVYYVRQAPEPVVEITVPEDSTEAARLGWFLGNQHLQIELGDGLVLLADDPQLRSKLERTGIHYTLGVKVFSPDPHSKGHHHH